MVQPNVSTLALLKEQRARKAAEKKAAEESETESDSQPENPPSASENSPVRPPQPSWDFSDEAAVPPAFRRKDATRSEPNTGTGELEHNPPIRSEKTRRSTPPVASGSIPAAIQLRRREPSPQPQPRHASQASQQLREHQTQSTQKRRSSPVNQSRRSKVWSVTNGMFYVYATRIPPLDLPTDH